MSSRQVVEGFQSILEKIRSARHLNPSFIVHVSLPTSPVPAHEPLVLSNYYPVTKHSTEKKKGKE